MNDIVQIDIEGARRLTERIRLTAVTVTESVDRLKTLVARAKESGAHTVLGYASWTAYLSEVLGETPMRLERDTRQELVAELTAQGMSTRAIAPIVGVSQMQVVRDVAGETKVSSAPVDQFDRDVAEAAAATSPPVEANPDTGEVIEPEPPRTVEGMDGKTYKVPAPKAKADNPSADLTLVNDIRLYLRKLASSPQVSRLTQAGKQHIITALQDAITQIEKD